MPHPPARLLVSRRRWQRQEQKQIDDPQLQPGSPPQPRPASRPPPVSKQFQTFCTSKAEIVHHFSRQQKRLSGGGEEAEECLFTNKGSWRQKGERSPPQSLLLALQSRAVPAACRGEVLIVCALLSFHRCLGPGKGLGCSHPGPCRQEAFPKCSGGWVTGRV